MCRGAVQMYRGFLFPAPVGCRSRLPGCQRRSCRCRYPRVRVCSPRPRPARGEPRIQGLPKSSVTPRNRRHTPRFDRQLDPHSSQLVRSRRLECGAELEHPRPLLGAHDVAGAQVTQRPGAVADQSTRPGRDALQPLSEHRFDRKAPQLLNCADDLLAHTEILTRPAFQNHGGASFFLIRPKHRLKRVSADGL